jgi:hypothetical protein
MSFIIAFKAFVGTSPKKDVKSFILKNQDFWKAVLSPWQMMN